LINPNWNTALNWHLNPSVNMTELEVHPLVIDDLEKLDETGYRFIEHPATITTLVIIIVGIIIAIGCCVYCFKCTRTKQQQETIRSRQPEGIELRVVQ